MLEPITYEEFAKQLAEVVESARRKGPPKLEHVAPPLNLEELRALRPGPIYEGFEEDIKRMRRGLMPLGPRK